MQSDINLEKCKLCPENNSEYFNNLIIYHAFQI